MKLNTDIFEDKIFEFLLKILAVSVALLVICIFTNLTIMIVIEIYELIIGRF